MKSIKEKAKENSLESRANAHCGYDEEDLEDSFEAGANYVLSVLNDAAYKDDWITNPKDGIRRFFEIYRQLKK